MLTIICIKGNYRAERNSRQIPLAKMVAQPVLARPFVVFRQQGCVRIPVTGYYTPAEAAQCVRGLGR